MEITQQEWVDWYNQSETQEFIREFREAAEEIDANFTELSRRAVLNPSDEYRNKAVLNAAYSEAYYDVLKFIDRLTGSEK